MKIDNPESFRNNIISKIVLKLKSCNMNEPDDKMIKMATNMEKGVFNACIADATKRNIIKKWENIYFIHLYTDKLRSIFANLNPNIIQSILDKKIRIHELAFMNHQEMKPEKWKTLLDEKRVRDENKYTPKIQASTDNFTCWKCKSKECTYYQLQTRSADEPMTTFVTCISCGQRWKC
jgi:DNA-directed RNA polymerase subunit M/transcription elongation factor TFIIS